MNLDHIEYQTLLKSIDESGVHWTIRINGQEFEYFYGTGRITITKPENKPYQSIRNPSNAIKIAVLSTPFKFRRGGLSRYDIDKLNVIYLPLPQLTDVLNCLYLDSQAHDESFDEFCSNYGYSNDSIKAKSIYDACNENYFKLRTALKSEYETIQDYIRSLDL